MNILEKNGKSIKYHIERKKIKHTYFRVKKDYVHITTNSKVKEQLIMNLLNERFDDLYQKISQKQVIRDDEIKLWQQTYHFHLEPGKFEYDIDGDHIYCKYPKLNTLEAKKAIYKKEIKMMVEYLRPQILKTLDRVNIEELDYKYKYLKSKFGSYHRKHLEITLNTFLATIDPIYLEYVIYHEYAHHKVFNHSKAFYDVLDQMMINHKKIQKTLKKMEII